MFSNLKETSIWDIMTYTNEHIEVGDSNTTQAVYDGEERGQTQRYLISNGKIIIDLFDKIEELFSLRDVEESSLSILNSELKTFSALFFEATASNRRLIEYFLDEIVNAYRLKGTESFMRWIIWKVFNWKLRSALTLASSVLRTTTFSSFLYDPALSYEENKVLYDPSLMTPDDKTILVVDVFYDRDFLDKKDTFENLAPKWGYISDFIYKHVNEVVNAYFEDSINGWSTNEVTFTVVSDQGILEGVDSGTPKIYQDFTLTNNLVYNVKVDFEKVDTDVKINVVNLDNMSIIKTTTLSSTGIYELNFLAEVEDIRLEIENIDNSSTKSSKWNYVLMGEN